jgi:hypothetical protein
MRRDAGGVGGHRCVDKLVPASRILGRKVAGLDRQLWGSVVRLGSEGLRHPVTLPTGQTRRRVDVAPLP